MADKTVVFITGANKGIGFETVRALVRQHASSRAYHVFLGTRSVENGHAAAGSLLAEFPNTASTIQVVQIDVSSDESIQAAYETVKATTGYLDVLVNNAGHALDNKIGPGQLTMREAWNQMYNVNVTGAQVVTHVFVPLLLQSKTKDARLLFLTSGLAQLETMHAMYYPGPPPKAGWPKQGPMSPDGYRSGKTGLNMMMLSWHWALREDGVKVWSISPGFLATDLGGSREVLQARGARDPSVGGILVSKVIEGERDADVGKVVSGEGIQPF